MQGAFVISYRFLCKVILTLDWFIFSYDSLIHSIRRGDSICRWESQTILHIYWPHLETKPFQRYPSLSKV